MPVFYLKDSTSGKAVPWPEGSQIVIVSTWGRIVYQGNGANTSWPPQDTLPGIYFLNATLPEGTTARTLKGWVEVIR